MFKNQVITIFAEEENSDIMRNIKKMETALSQDEDLESVLKLFGHSLSSLSTKMEEVSKMDPDIIYSKANKYLEDLKKWNICIKLFFVFSSLLVQQQV